MSIRSVMLSMLGIPGKLGEMGNVTMICTLHI